MQIAVISPYTIMIIIAVAVVFFALGIFYERRHNAHDTALIKATHGVGAVAQADVHALENRVKALESTVTTKAKAVVSSVKPKAAPKKS